MDVREVHVVEQTGDRECTFNRSGCCSRDIRQERPHRAGADPSRDRSGRAPAPAELSATGRLEPGAGVVTGYSEVSVEAGEVEAIRSGSASLRSASSDLQRSRASSSNM